MGLDRVDLIIIAVYLAGITAFGVSFRKRQRSLRDYFLADRNVPWWAISLSIVAAETSTLTIISIPGLAYRSNLTFLQLVMGYVVGRVIISFLLIPHYFRGELYTAYQLMERRFGGKLRSLTASLFLITRAAAEGVRVFAVAIVVRIMLGAALRGFGDFQRDLIAIGIVTALTLIYTFEGGMTAVIWTDVVQMFIYVGGTLVGFATLLHLVPGGWSGVSTVAGAAGKFRILDFSPEFFQVYTFWAGLIGGAFLTTASHGTDQLIVQRLLAARSEGQSKLALIASGLAVFFQFGLFLLVGVLLFVLYHTAASAPAWASYDEIFPTFIVTRMPHGVSGLLIAAILAAAMSNLSAALNSLSSSSMVDFYLRRRPETGERERLRLSRISTLLWAVVLFGLALLSRNIKVVVEVGLAIASVAYGALLGVFVLGVLTKKANERGAMVGFFCGFVFNLYLWQEQQLWGAISRRTGFSLALPHGGVPFTWYVALGCGLTFAIGYAASLLYARHPVNEMSTSSRGRDG
ncbi:MAG: sodium:solute symporter [Acidobacteriia bacterium]|nr:sodium:solute symporter [Terriglobia bacterium]